MNQSEVLEWLREEDKTRLDDLWAQADAVRKEYVGEAVHLRGLIEVSNHCIRQCGYCGLRGANQGLERYRMDREEILACARTAVAYGYGTVVMQGGEDPGISREWLAEIIRSIKAETPLAVTLSMGERCSEDLAAWREAGADRYLLRFETSDLELYRMVHPSLPGTVSDRFAILRSLQELGYEAGSGVLVGLPGQTYTNLADDICAFGELDLDMVGIGPFIPHPDTPLGTGHWRREIPEEDQVPNTDHMTYKAVALTRLLCPEANIPSTTALATINKESGREHGLARGANVVMPNLTPLKYRALYEIYPAKAGTEEASEESNTRLRAGIASIGRTIGKGPGGRIHSSHEHTPI